MVGMTLLAEAQAAGLTVLAGDDGKLTVRGPKTAEPLVRRLLEHKADLLAALAGNAKADAPPPTGKPAAFVPGCRCGTMATVDIPIHGGRSTRRDCAGCGRFVAFVCWYGQPTKHLQ